MSPSVQRVRRLSRSRGFLIAAAMVVGILVLQMITGVVGVIAATRQSTAAALETYSYVGDLTAERVARYAESARDVAEGTAVQIERDPDLTVDELAASLYFRLEREPTVRALYTGEPDGSFMVLQRERSGYTLQYRDGAPGKDVTSSDYDSRFRLLGTETVESTYDPRVRPWYQVGVASSPLDWTDPYLEFESSQTQVSPALAARAGSDLIAVAGADLELVPLGEVLDDLPLGEGAEAYVLSPDGVVIAVPASRLEEVQEISARTSDVVNASQLGLETLPGPLTPGEDYFTDDEAAIVLERTFEPSEELDWVLHIRADSSQLSPGLDRLSTTVVGITVFSMVIAIAAVLLAVRVWRPLRAMRERASTDQLTGLPNRHEYKRRGSALLARALERGDPVVAVALDLDNFKRLNDTYGHETGDYALESVALALRENIRAGDIAARTGGDEFVVVQVLSEGDDPRAVVVRTRDSIERALHTRVEGGEAVGVTAGYAVAIAGDRLDGLVARADAALVEGKQAIKGRVYGG